MAITPHTLQQTERKTDVDTMLKLGPANLRKLLGNAERGSEKKTDLLLADLREAFLKHEYDKLLKETKAAGMALRTAPMRFVSLAG